MTKIKISLAVALLSCLLPMPYGYFMIVRLVAMVLFAIIAYAYSEEKKSELAITFCALAVLFQPIIKIPLGRGLWNIIDVVVAVFLILLVFKKK